MELLLCTCGDCTHWEISRGSIICKTCSKEYPVQDLGDTFDAHVEQHPTLEWQEHER